MTIFIKIGGSLITDKTQEKFFRVQIAKSLATEIREAFDQNPDLHLLIGHGSGSFGHFAAKRHGTITGVKTAEQWRGFAKVAAAATELNHKVTKVFQEAGLPIWRLQPSASAICDNGQIITMETTPAQIALENGLIPLVHGDVAVDRTLGGTIISTETIFQYYAHHLPVKKILLLGEVAGVYNQDKSVIPEITPQNFEHVQAALGGSRGADVTGGMFSKVHDMLQLAQSVSNLQIHIINGTQPDIIQKALANTPSGGTLIHAP